MSDLVTLETNNGIEENCLVFKKTSNLSFSVPETTYPLNICFSPHPLGVLITIGPTKTILNQLAVKESITILNSIKTGEVVCRHLKGDKVYFSKSPDRLRITLRNYSFLFSKELREYLLNQLPLILIAKITPCISNN